MDLYSKAFDFLDAQEKKRYDLVFLDIYMPGMLGIEVAKAIRKKDDQTAIIFLTTSPDFALDAFELEAIHYLLKPFSKPSFTEAMDRAVRVLETMKTQWIQLKCPKSTVQSIDKNTITYIESKAHRQEVYLQNGDMIESVSTLSELFITLESISFGQFISPYKGFIVNQNEIKSIETDKIFLKSGKTIPIPRRTFNAIKTIYFKYMFGDKA